MKFPKSEQVVELLQSASGETKYVVTKSTKDNQTFTLWRLDDNVPVKVDKQHSPKKLRQIWLEEMGE